MKARFVIDRVAIEGWSLSSAEHLRFEDALHAALKTGVTQRMRPGARRFPTNTHSWRNALNLALPVDGDGTALGAALGGAISEYVWRGDVSTETAK